MTTPYEYRAKVVEVHDGDTIWLDVDLGFHLRIKEKFRILGLWAPELKQPNGEAARDHMRSLLPEGKEVLVCVYKMDGFRRWLADIKIESGYVSKIMIEAGFGLDHKAPGFGVEPKAE